MFRAPRTLLGVSPFAMFLMDQKKNPALKGLSIGDRGRALHKIYKTLTVQEKTALKRRAAQHPAVNYKKKGGPRVRRLGDKQSDFATFVKDNYHLVRGLKNNRRFAALSQMFELQKPLSNDLQKELRNLKRLEANLNREAAKLEAAPASSVPRKKATPKKLRVKKSHATAKKKVKAVARKHGRKAARKPARKVTRKPARKLGRKPAKKVIRRKK